MTGKVILAKAERRRLAGRSAAVAAACMAVGLPWVIDELEAAHRIFGPQIWDYSIEGSRATLEALVAYLDEQGLSRRRMSLEELFVPNIGPGLAEYLRATGED